MLTFGSLFAGIGGFDLGFERAGLRCIWQVEIDPFARKVLEKHWPHVKRHDDVRTFCRFAHEMTECDCCEEPYCDIHNEHFAECGCIGISQFADEWGQPDVLCGGFPCQDVSNAGEREGITGERSGLWFQFRRIIEAVSPKVVVIENVGGLASRGLDTVIGGLSEVGYDAEWCPLPAAAFGAVHRRERLFIVAYPAGNRLEGGYTTAPVGEVPTTSLDHLHHWPAISEPFGIRSLNGVPSGMDRINALGNAVVPHVAEWIGRRIVEVAAS